MRSRSSGLVLVREIIAQMPPLAALIHPGTAFADLPEPSWPEGACIS